MGESTGMSAADVLALTRNHDGDNQRVHEARRVGRLFKE